MGSINLAELEQLHARLERPVYNVVYRWVWSREDAHDIVQEVFLRLWKMRARVVVDTVEPLVYRIALNLARSRLRRQRLLRFVSLDSTAAVPHDPHDAESDLAETERRELVRRAVLALPEDLRQVVALCSFSELGYDEIARILSIPAGTVGSKKHRALKLLRESLAEMRRDRTGR